MQRGGLLPGARAAALLAAIGLGCSPAAERAPAAAALEPAPELGLDLEPVLLGTRQRPSAWVGGVKLRDRLGPTRSFELDRDYELELLPLALAGGGSAALETWLEVDGEEELVATSPLLPVARRPGLAGVARALETLRIPLAARPGRSGALSWRLAGHGPDTRALIVNPRLRPAAAAGVRPPDVLLVCSDTHRYDYALGGRSGGLMPRLDRLSRESVVYRRAFSTASWTLPSVASLLTGLFPRHHLTGRLAGKVPSEEFEPEMLPTGHFGFDVRPFTRILSGYPRQLVTLPERLRGVGYRTALVVSNPLYVLSGLAFDGVDLAIDVGLAPRERAERGAAEVLARAPRDRPLFLLVHLMDVHEWPRWYFGRRYPDLKPSQSPFGVRRSYLEAVRDTDRALEALLSAWDEARGVEDSMVVFFSDHGEHLLDPPHPRRIGHGNSMAEALLRVPLVVRYPDRLGRAPGAVDQPVSLADLAPTVLELAGLPVEPEGSSGRPLPAAAPAVDGRALFADFQLYGEEMSSVRRGRFKLVVHPDREHLELVEISPAGSDGAVSADEAASRELWRLYRAYVEEAERATAGLTFDRPIDQDEARRQLEALGYIQ